MTIYQIAIIVIGTTVLVLVSENKLAGLAIGLSYGVLMYLGQKRNKNNSTK